MQAEHDRFNKTVPDGDWSEHLFRLSPTLLCIAGTDGYFRRVNPAFHVQLGHTEAELLSRPFIEFVHPDDRHSTLEEVIKLSNGISAVHFENRYRHADGSYRWLLWNTTPVADKGLLYATAIDITERKQADERYRNLLNAVPDAIIMIDWLGKILKINDATETLFGYAPDALVGQSIEVLVPAQFCDGLRRHRNDHAKDPPPRLMGGARLDLVGVRKDGTEFPVAISLGSVDSQNFICAVRDTSLQKQREHELDASPQQLIEEQRQLKKLSTRLLLAEESERRRIARGLHDDVGQTLLAAKMSLDDLLESDVTEEAVSSAQEIRDLVVHAIETTQTLSFELASAALYEVGVGAALQSECELAQKNSGIRFQPPEQLTGRKIPMDVKIIVHRVGRELIRNIVKHSKAQTARLSLCLEDTALHLTVADDGQGFEAATDSCSPDPASGFGLFSIEQQLGSIGGTLDITSSPENGTRIVATVPLDAYEDRT